MFHYSLASVAEATLSAEGILTWPTSIAAVGIQDFRVQVSDGELSMVQTWSVKVWDDYQPVRLFVDVNPEAASLNETVTVSVVTTGGDGAPSVQLFVDDVAVALTAEGVATLTADTYGLHTVRVTASAGEATP